MSDWFDCLIGFGANLGDLHSVFERTQQALASADGIRNLVASQPRRTEPVGGPGQPQYLNAVFRLQTNQTASQFHAFLANLENQAGRDRKGRWRPRTLDLDLLLYGSQTIRTDSLCVPHPRMSVRRFVLEPAVEIAADMVHPVISLNISQLLDHLNQRQNQLVWVTEPGELAQRVIFGARQQLKPRSLAQANSLNPPDSGLASWTLVQASDRSTFESLCSTAKIVLWSNPRPSELRDAQFDGPQIELPESPELIDPRQAAILLENTIAVFQSEIVATIEAANG